ncbi:MAG: hypothetical protein MK116_07375 [Phycisphaerales bacterium]|nr:hypothetical protein [Phycisphaerales bacterium]
MNTRIIIALSLLVALTGCAPHFQASDLNGTWSGVDHTINSRGKSLTTKIITLNVDDNGLITGTTTWSLVDGPGGNHNDKPVASDSEDVIGAFDTATGEFYLVETRENGHWRGQMLSRDRVRAFLVQTGEKPVVSTVELTRQAD